MIQLNYNPHHHHSARDQASSSSAAALVKFELSDDNNNIIGSVEDLNNYTLTNSPYPPYGKETAATGADEADNSSTSKCDVDADTDSSVASSSYTSSFDDDMEDVKPKKSCLVQKSKLFIDTNDGDHLAEQSDFNDVPANATSSPLLSSDSGFPSSLSITSSCTNQSNQSNISLSMSSIQHTQTSNEPSSPTSAANATCLSSSPSTSVTSQPAAQLSKKRVLFADSCGKELFTIRTMSEPSNCPPKLTSKIVQYFINKEFNNSASMNDLQGLLAEQMSLGGGKAAAFGSSRQTQSANDLNYMASSSSSSSGMYQRDSGFFSLSRSYDYGISALNYTNDVNQLSGSIAVYSLNFAQPAGDYLQFRKRLEENFVSLENVVLNLFQINGTIKVKNVDYHKNIFVRVSFDGWKTHKDYNAEFVPSDFYSSAFSPSSPTSSTSATFYVSNNSSYVPQHKEFDTFRFEFQLPKTVHQTGTGAAAAGANDSTSNAGKELYTEFGYNGRNLNLIASIQMCVCYRCGQGAETREFWDSNHGKNYEILQYVIDIERLKPSKKAQPQGIKSTSSSSSSSKSTNFSPLSYHQNLFEFENVNGAARTDKSPIYY